MPVTENILNGLDASGGRCLAAPEADFPVHDIDPTPAMVQYIRALPRPVREEVP